MGPGKSSTSSLGPSTGASQRRSCGCRGKLGQGLALLFGLGALLTAERQLAG